MVAFREMFLPPSDNVDNVTKTNGLHESKIYLKKIIKLNIISKLITSAYFATHIVRYW